MYPPKKLLSQRVSYEGIQLSNLYHNSNFFQNSWLHTRELSFKRRTCCNFEAGMRHQKASQLIKTWSYVIANLYQFVVLLRFGLKTSNCQSSEFLKAIFLLNHRYLLKARRWHMRFYVQFFLLTDVKEWTVMNTLVFKWLYLDIFNIFPRSHAWKEENHKRRRTCNGPKDWDYHKYIYI